MIKLLQIEWLKNYSYKPVRIFSIIYFILITACVLFCTQEFSIFNFKINLPEQGVLDFPQLWNFVTYFAAILKIFLGFIIIFTITHEFSNKLFKQNIIDGLSKQEFIASKIMTMFFMSLLSTILVFTIGLILGYNYSEITTSDAIYKEIYFVFGYFFKLFTFLSFLFFLSVLFRKAIFVILATFIWWIIENSLSTAEYFLRIDIDSKEAIKKSLTGGTIFFTKYLPLNSMSELIVPPFQRSTLGELLGKEYTFETPTSFIIACFIYSAIFIVGSYYFIKKRDW